MGELQVKNKLALRSPSWLILVLICSNVIVPYPFRLNLNYYMQLCRLNTQGNFQRRKVELELLEHMQATDRKTGVTYLRDEKLDHVTVFTYVEESYMSVYD